MPVVETGLYDYTGHMMTRKHFIEIATILNANLAPDAIVADFADWLGQENPNFDRPRFFDAATERRRKHMRLEIAAMEREVQG